MTKFKTMLLIAALATFAILPIAGAKMASSAAITQTPATKVSYAPIPGGDYKIDPAHSTVGFSIRHYEINWVVGRFKDFDGTIRFDDADITKSSVDFAAKIASVDTGVAARDQHLQKDDFFDAAKYPQMMFKSTRVERKGKSGYVLHGDLTLHGVTKPVAIPFTIAGAIKDSRGNTRFGIEAQTKINRRDYGMNYGSTLPGGGFDIGNEVTINLNLEALKPAPKTAGQ
ncbi:MAG TPA: YceI family protein [Blastocatellia bacterium]|jgi:polyisoprenoid-binding protein YceI